MTLDKQRFHDLLGAYQSAARQAVERYELFTNSSPGSADAEMRLQVFEQDLKPELEKMSNELCMIILSSAQRGKQGALSQQDINEGQRIMAEVIESLKRAGATGVF